MNQKEDAPFDKPERDDLARYKELAELPDDVPVDVRDASKVLGLKVGTLNSYRSREPKMGPPFQKYGLRAVRYLMGDLRTWAGIALKSGAKS